MGCLPYAYIGAEFKSLAMLAAQFLQLIFPAKYCIGKGCQGELTVSATATGSSSKSDRHKNSAPLSYECIKCWSASALSMPSLEWQFIFLVNKTPNNYCIIAYLELVLTI